MTIVKFKEENEGDGLTASVDLIQPLSFDASGNASVDLPDGVHHVFWAAFGPPTAKVTMQIIAPAEAVFAQSDSIGPTMKNAWAHEFHVGALAAFASIAAAKPPKVHTSVKKFVAPKSTKKGKGKKK